MIRRAAALLLGISIGTATAQTASSATLELTRNSRPVTAQEAAGGAPAGGMVHDFFVTSDADLLVLGPEINVSVYKHPYNSNHEAPDPELVAMYPAVGASSFLRLPSETIVLGGGFAVPGSGWGDLNNDGPQSNFHFGRLTTTQSGTFAGNFYVRGEDAPITLPFSLSLPGPGEGLLSQQLSVAATAPTAPVTPDPITPPLDPPANPQPPVPTPTVDPFAYSEKSKTPVSVSLTRRTRPVTGQEIAAGAPDGYVHEFLVTSSTDIIDIRSVALDLPAYQHESGHDNRFPSRTHVDLFPGVSADSFLDTPGTTNVEGGFAKALEGSGSIWYDRHNNGPQDEFLFARLTVCETGNFSGAVSVAGPDGRIELPFDFVLPATAEDLALIEQEPKFSLTLEPAALSQIPEPSTVLLAALAGLFGATAFPRRRSAALAVNADS